MLIAKILPRPSSLVAAALAGSFDFALECGGSPRLSLFVLGHALSTEGHLWFLLLVSPSSGTGTLACAPFLRQSFRSRHRVTPRSMSAREQAEVAAKSLKTAFCCNLVAAVAATIFVVFNLARSRCEFLLWKLRFQ
jgi:hypothetical protein